MYQVLLSDDLIETLQKCQQLEFFYQQVTDVPMSESLGEVIVNAIELYYDTLSNFAQNKQFIITAQSVKEDFNE